MKTFWEQYRTCSINAKSTAAILWTFLDHLNFETTFEEPNVLNLGSREYLSSIKHTPGIDQCIKNRNLKVSSFVTHNQVNCNLNINDAKKALALRN